jgi:hypothetical protein
LSHTVNVTNLPSEFDSAMLEDLFMVIGNVRSVQILKDAESGPRGLVEMSSEEEVHDCIRYFIGHALVVSKNAPHIPQPPIFKTKIGNAKRKVRVRK